jgi:hypothetical protein
MAQFHNRHDEVLDPAFVMVLRLRCDRAAKARASRHAVTDVLESDFSNFFEVQFHAYLSTSLAHHIPAIAGIWPGEHGALDTLADVSLVQKRGPWRADERLQRPAELLPIIFAYRGL